MRKTAARRRGARRRPAGTGEKQEEGWVSGHVYYHEDLDRVVRGFVHPLVVSLGREERIRGFFFIRHGLGGPHVRLRLRPVAGAGERVLDEMEHFAYTFLDREPSTRALDPDSIRRANESILKADLHEIDGSAYPDNSFHVLPFRPEIERYGGPNRFRLSLDCFTLSSVAALDFQDRFGSAARPVQLARAYELLLRQALGFASGEDELTDLLRYGVDWLGHDLPKVIEKADGVAQSQMESFLRIFSASLGEVRSLRLEENLASLFPQDLLVAGVARLSAAVEPAESQLRLRTGASQLHMTASRLGITNAEEVYLSRILTVTLGKARALPGTDLSWLRERVAGDATHDAAKALRRLLPHALAALAGLPAGADRG